MPAASTAWTSKLRRLFSFKTRTITRRPGALQLRFDQLEARVTPDATIAWDKFTLTAIGATASFAEFGPTDVKNPLLRPEKAEVPDGGVMYIMQSKFPIEVSVKGSSPKQVLFMLPEGGEFRWGRTGKNNFLYQDFVPRYGVITVPNGLSSTSTVAQQQTVTVPGTTGTFTLSWGGKTTPALKAGASADEIETALNALSSIKDNAGAVEVVKNGAAYTVTFGGAIAAAPAILTIAPTGITGKASVAPVTMTAITKRLPNAKYDGFETFRYPFKSKGQYLEFQSQVQSANSPVFITIPAGQATTFPTAQSPAFTPTAFGFYPTNVNNVDSAGNYKTGSTWDTRLIGTAELQGLGGSIVVGAIADQKPATQKASGETSGGFSRIVASTTGFTTVIPSSTANPAVTITTVGVDSNNRPRPITFPFAGLNFEATPVSFTLNYDKATNSLNLPTGGTLEATAAFAGGKLKLKFGSFKLDLTTNTVTASTTPTFVSLTLGEFVIPASDAFKMAYDAAAQKFTFTINNVTLDSSASIMSLITRTFDLTEMSEPFTLQFANGSTAQIGRNPTTAVVQDALRKAGLNATVTQPTAGGPYKISLPISDGIFDMFEFVRIFNSFNGDPDDLFFHLSAGFVGDQFDPMKIAIPSGTITLTKGTLGAISDLDVSSFEIGKIVPNFVYPQVQGNPLRVDFTNTFLPAFKPFSASEGLKLNFTTKNVYNADGTVRIPTDSFGVYGKGKTPLNVDGLQIPDAADLGTTDKPGLIVTNSTLTSLSFAVGQVTVAGLTFVGADVGGVGKLKAAYYPQALGIPQEYVIEGGAKLKPGGTVFKSDMSAVFGGNGSAGIRISPNSNKFTFSFGIVGPFIAGANTIEPDSGVNGMKVTFDGATKKYLLTGSGNLDFNPTTAANTTAPKLTGTKLKIYLAAPVGVTNFAANTLDGTTLNLFLGDQSELNGFKVKPLPTTDPLRVTVTAAKDTIGGDFGMQLEGNVLYGNLASSTFTGGIYPKAGVTITWSKGADATWKLGGVLLSGLSTSTLTESLSLPFQTSTYDGKTLATGAVGSEPNVVVAKKGVGDSAKITRSTANDVGDVKFTSFTATYDFTATPRKWTFAGPGTFFATPVTVGGTGNPSAIIGGDAVKGFQLQLKGFPVAPTTGAFPLTDFVTMNGVTFDLKNSKNSFFKSSSTASSVTYKLNAGATISQKVNVGRTEYDLTISEFTITVSAAGGVGNSIAATVKKDSNFTIGNLSITAGNALSLAYDGSYKISGDAKISVQAGIANVVANVNFGTLQAPGLVIKDGVVESLKMSVTGTFKMLGMDISIKRDQKVSIEYVRAQGRFVMYGDMTMASADQNSIKIINDVNVTLGESADKAGIVINGGQLETLDVVLSGNINLYSVSAKAKDVHIKYSLATKELRIGGEVEVTLVPSLVLTSKLSLLINTQTGKVTITGLKLKSDGDIKFKAVTLKGLEIHYEDDGTNVTVGAGCIIGLPSGFEVGGSIELKDGKLNGIGIHFGKNPGILVAGGLVNIYAISGSVKGLQNPSEDFEISATVQATVGPAVSLGGETHALVDVSGTITVNTTSLTLEGKVKLINGYFGHGTFKGTVNWKDVAKVEFNSYFELFPGGIIRGSMSAYIDAKGNVDFDASIGVYVPRNVPVVGDVSLGTIRIGMRVRPELAKRESYISFDVKWAIVTGGATVRFSADVEYRLGLDFGLFSATKTGTFSFRDLTAEPTVWIDSATATDGAPDGVVTYHATSALPETSTIDFYADTDAQGNDGILIGSAPYQPGQQTFVWKNMAAFAPPGTPVYVYAKINDGKQGEGISKYSSSLSTSPGFVPTINKPAAQSYGPGQTIVFSSANGNAISVVDPRLASDPTSQMQVTVHVGGGMLDLSQTSATVTETGLGTDQIVLTGTAADINALLDGLIYEPDSDSIVDHQLTVSAAFLPLENLSNQVTTTVNLKYLPLAMHVLPSEYSDGTSATDIARGETGQRPLQVVAIEDSASGFITGATIAIGGYVQGQDVVGFSVNDEIATVLKGSFEPKTGVLSLSGFGSLETYEDALGRITFFTTSSASSKNLTITLADDYADHGSLAVPLKIVNGIAPPTVDVGQLGLKYVQGGAATPIAPSATITAPAGSLVTGMTVAFTPDSYRSGEDVLAYTGSDIPATFDASAGVLTFTGGFTAQQYQQALRNVVYVDQGSSFHVGLRDLIVTVTDDADSHNVASALVVIADDASAAVYVSPSVTLSTNQTSLPADQEFVQLDPNLDIADDVTSLIGATVTISTGYVPGEDVLGIGEIASGVRVAFDPAAGVLRLTGVASVDDYKAMLRSVILENLDGDRATARSVTVSFSVTDGLSAPSTPQSLQVNEAAAPFLDASLDDVALYVQGQSTVAIDTGLKIDYPSPLSGATVAIYAGYHDDEDQLIFTNQNGITGAFDSATGALTLSGAATAAQYQAALDSVRYYNSRHNPIVGDRLVSYQVFDGAIASNFVKAEVNVNPVVVGPTITIDPSAPTFVENGPAVLVAPNIALAPADATTYTMSAQPMLHGVEIDIAHYVAGEDVLSFVDRPGITGRWNPDQGSLFLSGDASLDDYQAAVRTVTYSNTSDAPRTTPRTIYVRLFDTGGGGMNDSVTTTLAIQAADEAPVRSAGTISAIATIESQEAVSLGLSGLRYAPAAGVVPGNVALKYVPTHLPSESLGEVLLADGTPLALGTAYPLSELAGLKFVPAVRGSGSDTFAFAVQATDPISGNFDGGKLVETVPIAVQGVATATASEAFVAAVYRDLFGVNPDAATLSHWAGVLDQDLASSAPAVGVDPSKPARADVVNGLMNSDAFRTHEIQWIYQHLLGRSATSTEIATALAGIAGGASFSDVRIALAGSAAYLNLHGNRGPIVFVNDLYSDLLGRSPTFDEQQQWFQNLRTGGGTPASVAQAIGHLPGAIEHANDALFEEYLRRDSTDDDVDTYFLPRTDDTGLIFDLLISDEYYERNSTPSTSPHVANQVTNAFPSVGKVGDAGGDHATGTLIAPQYALVAAHSVAGIPPGQITFTIGGVVHHVADVFVHPDFDHSAAFGESGANDIAILKLDTPVAGIAPSLLYNGPPQVGETFNLVGFGAHNDTPFGIERIGSTPPVNNVLADIFTWTHRSKAETDSTPGDSGAPLFVQDQGVDYVIGIVSGGTDPDAGLGDVATNTRVDAYLAWIQTITGPLTAGSGRNLAPTDIVLSNSSIGVKRPIGSVIGDLSAVDADAGQGHSFSLVAGLGSRDNAKFAIVNGQLVTNAVFDVSQGEQFSVRVRVVDAAGGSFEKALTLLVGPLVKRITRDHPVGPVTGARNVAFEVTFNEAVLNVDESDFIAATGGTVAFNTMEVTQEAESAFVVTLRGVTGDGSLGLNLVDDGTITDLIGNPLINGTEPAAFETPQTFASGAGASSALMTDVDGDGVADFVSTNGGASITVALMDVDQPPRTFAVGKTPVAVAAADLDRDGRADLVVVNRDGASVSVLLGLGDGTFAPQRTVGVGARPSAVAIGDFNGDGKADLVVTNTANNYLSVLLGAGDGTFAAPRKVTVGGMLSAVVVADFNHDGKLDVVAANQVVGIVHVLLGDGAGAFAAPKSFAVGSLPSSLAVADLNGDGDIDLVVANRGSNSVSVLLGNGNGTFQAQKSYATGPLPRGLTLGDANGDGLLDVLVANGGGSTVSVLLGNGDGSYKAQKTFPAGASPTAVMLSDVNGNGSADLVIASDSGAPATVLPSLALGNATGQTYVIDHTASPLGGPLSALPTVTDITLSGTNSSPRVNGVAPFVGPTSGGTTIVITGANFLGVVGPAGVRFGGVNALSYVVNSASQITAVAPPGVPAIVDVVVTSVAGASDTTSSVDNYTYAVPALTSVVVNGGPIAAKNKFGQAPNLANQNSVVEQILVTFNQPVKLDAHAFNVTSLFGSVTAEGIAPSSVGAALTATGVTGAGDDTVGFTQYVLTFDAGAGVNSFANAAPGNSFTTLKDGFYQLNMTGSLVRAGISDTAADFAEKFWVLYGAANAGNVNINGGLGAAATLQVDGLALNDVHAAFGSRADSPSVSLPFKAAYDWNLDGFVDGSDLSHMYSNFGTVWKV